MLAKRETRTGAAPCNTRARIHTNIYTYREHTAVTIQTRNNEPTEKGITRMQTRARARSQFAPHYRDSPLSFLIFCNTMRAQLQFSLFFFFYYCTHTNAQKYSTLITITIQINTDFGAKRESTGKHATLYYNVQYRDIGLVRARTDVFPSFARFRRERERETLH